MKKRTYVKVTPEQVFELYKRGYNFSQIAKHLGCARNTVRKKVYEYVTHTGSHVYIGTKPIRSKYSPDQIVELWEDGYSVREIAIDGGVSRSYVYKVLKDFTNARR
jgi:transposase